MTLNQESHIVFAELSVLTKCGRESSKESSQDHLPSYLRLMSIHTPLRLPKLHICEHFFSAEATLALCMATASKLVFQRSYTYVGKYFAAQVFLFTLPYANWRLWYLATELSAAIPRKLYLRG